MQHVIEKNEMVSVIIPCYNQGRFIEKCIQSVLDQTYQNFEIVIVNDGSTDPETVEVLSRKKWPNTTVLHRENGGLASARNFGYEHTKGSYIQFLDSDDFLSPEKFLLQIEAMKSSGADICYSEYRMYDYATQEIGPMYSGIDIGDDPYKAFLLKWERGLSIPIHCALFRRDAWSDRPFVEGFKAKEDWIMWCDLAFRGKKFCRTSEVLAYYGRHGGNMTNDSSSMVLYLINAAMYVSSHFIRNTEIEKVFRSEFSKYLSLLMFGKRHSEMFLDYGKGFNQEDSLEQDIPMKGFFKQEWILDSAKFIKQFLWRPFYGIYAKIKVEEIILVDHNCHIHRLSADAIRHNGQVDPKSRWIRFITFDPQFIVRNSGFFQKIEIHGMCSEIPQHEVGVFFQHQLRAKTFFPTCVYGVDAAGNHHLFDLHETIIDEGRFEEIYNISEAGVIHDLRWDPVEGCGCIIRLDRIYVEDKFGKSTELNPNAFRHNGEVLPDNTLKFITTDPQIYTGLYGEYNNIIFSGYWKQIPIYQVEMELRDSFHNKFVELSTSIERAKMEADQARMEIAALKKSRTFLFGYYSLHFWKSFRKVLEKIFRKLKLLNNNK